MAPSPSVESITTLVELGLVFLRHSILCTIARLWGWEEGTQPAEPPVLAHHLDDVATQVLTVLVPPGAVLVVRLPVPDLHQLQAQECARTEEDHKRHGSKESGDERDLKVAEHPRHHGEHQGRDEAPGEAPNNHGHDPRAHRSRVGGCDEHVDEEADEEAVVVITDAPSSEVTVVVSAQYAGLAQRAVPRAGGRVLVARLAEHPSADVGHREDVPATRSVREEGVTEVPHSVHK